MVERKKELKRRYHRKQKMYKLKLKLSRTEDPQEKEKLLEKIHFLSPFWKEPETSA